MLLAEKLLLLGLDQTKGNVIYSAHAAINFGLAGAILMDLVLMNRISVIEGKVVLTNTQDIEDPILHDVLVSIAKSKRIKSLRHWVLKLGSHTLRNKIAHRLVKKGILQMRKRKILGIIPYTRYPENNPLPELQLRTSLRNIVLNGIEPKEEDLILLSLVKACNLTKEIFTKEERKMAKKNIDELIKGQAIGKVVQETVAAMNAAIISAVAAASAANSSGS